ncbi:MAG: glycine zipper 2TM domain-containing protein [Steroidobacteraceae bacterium]
MNRTAKNVSRVIGVSLGLLSTMTAWSAVEYAKVISRTPVLEQVLVPREACRDQATTVQPPKSGAGALVGAIAGGVLGHQVGDGSGRVLATTVGAVGGAVIGDRLEPAPATRVITTRRCVTEQVIENRVAAYAVVYEWGGKQYRTQLDHDPGESLALEISPLRSSTVSPPVVTAPNVVAPVDTTIYPATPVYSTTRVYPATTVYSTPPVYRDTRLVFPSVGVSYVYVQRDRAYHSRRYDDHRYSDRGYREYRELDGRHRDRDGRKYRHGD